MRDHAHQVVISGYTLDGEEYAFGVAVTMDGKPLRGVKRAHVVYDSEQYAIVSLTFAADVQVQSQIEVLAVIDPATEKTIREQAAEAVADVAVTAARKNYLQVRDDA